MMNGEIMRQGGQVSHMRHGQGAASEPSLQNDTVRDQPGILIFSRRQNLLYINRRALELTAHLDQAESGPVCEIHSAPVRELRNAIQAALDHRRDANIWEIFGLKRVLFGARGRLLVRGFGLADRISRDDSRIVIVLEELGLRQEPSEPQRQVMHPSRVRGGGRRAGNQPNGGAVKGWLLCACNGGAPEPSAILVGCEGAGVSQRILP